MADTKIEWAEKSWNPITGCTKVSPACDHCYAERMAKRLAGRCGYPKDDPFRVTFHEDRLTEPLKWKKPRQILVCSMSDLFHKDVKDEWIDHIFTMMALCKQHVFMLLTKRTKRMVELLTATENRIAGMAKNFHRYVGPTISTHDDVEKWCKKVGITRKERERRLEVYSDYCNAWYLRQTLYEGWTGWPIPNVWLGVTAEDQQRADERIPLLLQCPAAKRFVSCEPLLGPIDLKLSKYGIAEDGIVRCKCSLKHPKRMPDGSFGCGCGDWSSAIDWVIAGGETGPGARPSHPDSFRGLRDQCQAAGVPFFFKGWGDWAPTEQFDVSKARADSIRGIFAENGNQPLTAFEISQQLGCVIASVNCCLMRSAAQFEKNGKKYRLKNL